MSFAGALVAAIAFLMAAREDGPAGKTWGRMGKIAFLTHAGSVLGVIGTLFYLIYSHQFQYHYVWSHSSNELPVYYMISCFWEGQEGSFLLWTFWHAVLGSILLFTSKKWRNVVMGVIASVNLILASMILGVYVPGAGGSILYALAVLVPAGYLGYRFYQQKDDFNSKGLVPLMGIATGVIALGLAISNNTGFLTAGPFSGLWTLGNTPFLLAFFFVMAFLGYLLVQLTKVLSGEETKILDTKTLFSAFILFALGLVAMTTEFATWKVGSSPFLLLRDAFPDAPIFKSNPEFSPINGNGLNPLLQNYWMVIHPPTLFLGFASTVVPFAYVIGGLVTGRYTEWIRPAVPWLIFSVMILGVGIIMGGYWAYETLNFGGYWNWDPVENSSFVPWLAGIASLHALVAYRKSKAFLKMTMLLVVGTFLLVLYSTFLTRSGILGETSVHTFTDLGLSGQLIMLMMVYVVGMAALFMARWKDIPEARKTIAVKSAEFVLFLGILVLIGVGVVITIATSIPVFNAILGTNWAPVKDGPFFYYRWTIWFAIGLALLSGIGQFLFWRKVENKKVSSAMLRPYLLAMGVAVVIIASILFFTNWEFAFESRYNEWKELADLSGSSVKMGMRYIKLVFFVFADEIMLFSALFMVFANMDIFIQLLRRKKATRIVTGGSIAHIGFGMMLVGFLFSSGFDQVISKNINPNELAALPQDARVDNVLLEKGNPREIVGYQVTYLGKKEAVAPVREVTVLWETEDEFKVSFLDSTGGTYATQLPRLVFLNKEGEVNLPFVKEFLDDKVEFLKPKYINDRTLYGVRFVPRYRKDDGTLSYDEEAAFTLYPEAEVNPEMGLIAHPSRKILPGSDIYVHVSTIPKAEEEQPRFEFDNFTMSVGDTVQTGRAAIYFDRIVSEPVEGTTFALIAAAELKVVTDKGKVIKARPLYRIDESNRISVKDHYIDEINTSIAFVSIDPTNGKIGLQVQERVNPPDEIIVIQALRKPFINILWLGTFVLVGGFIVAIVRRVKENMRQ